MTVVLEAKNLRKVYPIRRGMFKAPARLQAVGGVSFSIEAARTLAVVGESGCGKSTLARVVALIETPSAGRPVPACRSAALRTRSRPPSACEYP